MSTKGDVVSVAWPGHAARSNIQAGISSQRSASDPLSVQRKSTPPALPIVPWTQTRRPNHGCHRYKSSRKPVPWVFSSLVVQRMSGRTCLWTRIRRAVVRSNEFGNSLLGRSSADFIISIVGFSSGRHGVTTLSLIAVIIRSNCGGTAARATSAVTRAQIWEASRVA